MDCSSFYGRKKVSAMKVTTLDEAHEEVRVNDNIFSLIVLPPMAGDQDIDSDIEEVPEDLEEDVPFETAGELEVEELVTDEEISFLPEDDSRKNKKIKVEYKWNKKMILKNRFGASSQSSLISNFPFIAGLQPFAIWKLFFDAAMIEMIINQTNLYAHREKNEPDFEIMPWELMRFLGIILLSGYHTVPKIEDYWSNQPDLNVKMVSEAMSKTHFLTIKKYFHLTDNRQLPSNNKVAKVSSVYEYLNSNLVQFGVWQEHLSVDESMVPYYGRHSCKMFIRGKPIRFGYKIWCLCGDDGYPYHMKIYTGRETANTTSADPLGTRIVKHMMDVIKKNSQLCNHQFFFDNFFSSITLISELSNEGLRSTGTIRENRMSGANKHMVDTKSFKKLERGSYDYTSNGEVHVVKWNDNSIVHLVSNHLTHEPIQHTNRRVKGQKNKVSITQPHLIKQYNEHMGGVDLLDRLLGSYRPMIRGKSGVGHYFSMP